MSTQMFSDDNDISEDDELADSGGCSSSLGFSIGCLVFLIATFLLVAVLAQFAVTSQPGRMEPAHLFRLAVAGMALIIAGTVVTIRVAIAASEKSKGRFSLLSLFVLMTLLCVVLGFIAYTAGK
jgi:heme/copper-type cytochrome/quinol oxidase subunit 3